MSWPVSQLHQWDTPLHPCCTLPALLQCFVNAAAARIQIWSLLTLLNSATWHARMILIRARWKTICPVWCGSVKGFMPADRSPRDSVFKQSEAHMSTALFWEPLSPWWSSRTQRARCPASALTTLDTIRLLIAAPAFIELQPYGGKRQVQTRSGGTSHRLYF